MGRFQPFHQGHLLLVLKALDQVSYLKIGIGSMQYDHTKENPFTFLERKEMIDRSLHEAHIPKTRYEIFGIPDLHDMEKWTLKVLEVFGNFDVFYSNNEWTRQLFLKQGKAVAPLYQFDFERYNGTNIRKRIQKGESINQLVPPAVETYLKEIEGFSRIH